VYTCTRPCTPYTAVYRPCTRHCTGCVLYTVVYTGHVHTRPVYTAVYTVVYTCTRPSTGRIHGPYTAVYTVVCTAVYSIRGRVTAVYTGRVLCLYTAVYTACTWPSTRSCTRLHGPYTKPTEFWTFSQTVVITSVNKTKHHFAFYRKFIKYGVKRGSGIKILYLLTGPIPCPTNVSDRLDWNIECFPPRYVNCIYGDDPG